MEWPCGKCLLIRKHPYGHYYGVCEGCRKMEEYEAWSDRQETKRILNLALQKAKVIKGGM